MIKSLRQYYGEMLLILLCLVLLVGVRINAEASRFGMYHEDEYHTIHQGISYLVHGKVEVFRAQESVRWLVRLFYPYALVSMNTHMGGNVQRDGWSYPGHNYVVQHFIDQPQDIPVFQNEPNIRLLIHALRVPYIAFVAAAVFLLAFKLYYRRWVLTAFGLVCVLGFSLALIEEQKILYIEPGILASLGLFITTYLVGVYRHSTSRYMILLYAFLAAFMVSTKFSTVIFTLLPLVLLMNQYRGYELLKKSLLYAGASVLAYILINFSAFSSLENFNHFLHDLSSNFWQYAAGSDPSVTVAPGVMHLSLIVDQLEGTFGYFLYVMPLIIIFGIRYASRFERWIVVPLTVITGMSILTISLQHVFLTRNVVPFLLPLAISALLSLEIVYRSIIREKSLRWARGMAGFCVLLWMLGVIMHAGGVTTFTTKLLPNTERSFLTQVELLRDTHRAAEWYAVGLPGDVEEQVHTIKPEIHTKAPVPSVLSSKQYPALIDQYATLASSSVVMVYNSGNNKHLTEYILPKFFNQNKQYGKYFVYYNTL